MYTHTFYLALTFMSRFTLVKNQIAFSSLFSSRDQEILGKNLCNQVIKSYRCFNCSNYEKFRRASCWLICY